MKTFKKIFSISLMASIFFLSSCKEDEPDVDIDDRDLFVGSWNVSDNIAKQNYSVSIKKDANNSTKIWLSNFHATDSAFAYISSKNVSLPNQQIATGLYAKGTALMVGTSKINWEYTVNDGADEVTIIATYLK